MIRRIREAGIATVIVDKNHAQVMALADRVVLLIKGRVVFAGPSGELRNRPELLRQHLGV